MAQPNQNPQQSTAADFLDLVDQEAADAKQRSKANGARSEDGRDDKKNGNTQPNGSRNNLPPTGPRDRYSEEREENDRRRIRRRSLAHSDDLSDDSEASRANRHSRRGSRGPPQGRGLDSYRPGDERDRGQRARSPRRDDRRDHRRDGGRDDRRRRSRSRSRNNRARSRSPRRGEGRRPTRERSPLSDPETAEEAANKDGRTVFVQQLSLRLRERDLRKFFENAGPTVSARLVTDRVSGRSKGVGYVEFADAESVPIAISYTGQKLLTIPVIVQAAEAEKNRQPRVGSNTPGTLANGVPFHRLYVGNVHFNVTDDMLKEIFTAYGDIENFVLQKDDNGRSKGYGFVQYKLYSAAKQALTDLNGMDLAGRLIRVGLGSDKFTNESTDSLLKRFDAQAEAHELAQRQTSAQTTSASLYGLGGRGHQGSGMGGGNREKDRNATNASALEDSDMTGIGEGISYNKYDRHDLMQKLSRQDREEKVAPKPKQKPIYVEPTATTCLLVKNCYREDEAASAAERSEIIDEFGEEASSKFGNLLHCAIGGDMSQGELYMKFGNTGAAKRGYQNLNGRYFDQRMLTADYISERIYDMNFPDAVVR